MKKKDLIVILSIVGLLVSLYLTYSFYNPNLGGFCNISQTLNCDKVTTSKYSVFFGVPVSLLGVIYFLVNLFLIYLAKNKESKRNLLLWNCVGLASIVYLISVEFILKSICIWCTLVHIIVIFGFYLTLKMYR